ncbi:coiled-coil domain-containing protein 189 isoform X2 [Electrophorus electricus]|uniref:coiled-coil domain-containing protein 189 isoform X2 n=1 Tax=Electrophorus electricus TaxID=8005 RepID=UPI000F0A37BA|nr:coiled-coil domain-containing protein 189 isoform X2 [Electrophorus electricus]
MKTENQDSDPLKVRILLWANLSYSDMEEIDQTESITDIERILFHALNIDVPEPRLGILLELYTNIVLFCRKRHYNREQTSVLLSIVKSVHQVNIETPLNNMDQCFSYFTELLLCHSVRRPPFSISLFSLEQVTDITKYFINTYMRHYMLYKYIFTPQMYMDLSLTYTGMPESTDTEELASSDNGTKKDAERRNEQGVVSTETLTTDTEGACKRVIQVPHAIDTAHPFLKLG